MINDARLDFELNWMLKDLDLNSDPFRHSIRDVKIYPYRLYINDELLAERDFNVHDRYYILETHHLRLDSGQYAIRVEELSGFLDIEIRDFRLNTVKQPSWVFNMP